MSSAPTSQCSREEFALWCLFASRQPTAPAVVRRLAQSPMTRVHDDIDEFDSMCRKENLKKNKELFLAFCEKAKSLRQSLRPSTLRCQLFWPTSSPARPSR